MYGFHVFVIYFKRSHGTYYIKIIIALCVNNYFNMDVSTFSEKIKAFENFFFIGCLINLYFANVT